MVVKVAYQQPATLPEISSFQIVHIQFMRHNKSLWSSTPQYV